MTPIPSTHLRSGNIVSGRPIPLAFLIDVPHEIFPLSAQDIWLIELGKYDCYGVPITEEVLKRCGFVFESYGDDVEEGERPGFYSKEYVIAGDTYNKIVFIEGDRMGYMDITMLNNDRIRFGYLHELMNAVFSLTGEELTYTVT